MMVTVIGIYHHQLQHYRQSGDSVSYDDEMYTLPYIYIDVSNFSCYA